MNYAVIQTGGKQYKVKVGDILELDRVKTTNKKIEFDKVLLLSDGEELKVGMPYVADARVVGEVLKDTVGKKIRVLKFRAKSRYRRVLGFRPKYTLVKIEKIEKGREGKPKTTKKTETK
jgi:large subunit ribosomal protein L21